MRRIAVIGRIWGKGVLEMVRGRRETVLTYILENINTIPLPPVGANIKSKFETDMAWCL